MAFPLDRGLRLALACLDAPPFTAWRTPVLGCVGLASARESHVWRWRQGNDREHEALADLGHELLKGVGGAVLHWVSRSKRALPPVQWTASCPRVS